MAKNSIYNPKSDPHRIALYVRVSTEEQAENPEGSIRNQEDRLRAAVALRNMEGPFGEIVEVFIDRARSGKDTNRPELQRMLAAIRRKEVTLVLVTELSRLSRSIKDFSEIWEMMRASSCGFQSLRENFDTTSAAGEMVLYTVANIAQFERRQCSERVSANFQARAARGLYNGGILPIGYQLIPERPGYLDVDEAGAATVRAAFNAFLQEETLARAAKWLNSNGYAMKREIQGGNHRPRLGHFTVDNLHHILCNRSYLGIRKYLVKGVPKETQAAWPTIIDPDTYDRVQKLLRANHRRKKPESESRYPYQLTGLVFCGSCSERMVGKSAHGRSGKVGYYEHGWSRRRQACLDVKSLSTCRPYRLQAKKLEPAVWEIVSNYLKSPKAAQELIRAAEAVHRERSKSSESRKVRDKIRRKLKPQKPTSRPGSQLSREKKAEMTNRCRSRTTGLS
jgi:site-specific DNA recombinase